MELTGSMYDEAGNLIARTEDTGDLALAQFTYDGIDRLDTAAGAFGSRDYDLDRNGNRNKVVADGVTTTYTYPRNRYRKHENQPTRDTFWTYTHDANGSITAKTSTVGAPDLGYEYDVHNRLIRTTSDDGTVTTSANTPTTVWVSGCPRMRAERSSSIATVWAGNCWP